MKTRVYYGPSLGAYGFPSGHPFGSDRLEVFWRECQRRGLDKRVDIATPVACGRDDLLRFHTETYINLVERLSATGYGALDDGDTPAFPGVYEAACTVVGSVLDSRCAQAFIPIAGLHHARREGAAGFCAVNDIGVLIEWLRAEHRIQRIAYVDIDAHHGDGVFYGFASDPALIFADIHEDGRHLYPGTGTEDEIGVGDAKGTKLNLPLAPGADDAAFHAVWPRVEAFVRAGNPEFIILQAGADNVAGDPLTHMRFSPAVHRHAATRLRAIAHEHCQSRFIAMGGGGYNRANVAAAWCEVVEGMLEA